MNRFLFNKLLVFNIFDCNGQVIYGDTDSIMIHTGLDDISKAKTIAGKVIQEVRFWMLDFYV